MSSTVIPHKESRSSSFTDEMNVVKRNGELEVISFDKILRRIRILGSGQHENGVIFGEKLQINYTALVIKVVDQLYDKIPTTKIDELTAEQCAYLSTTHSDYNKLAGRIIISNHHKNTLDSFAETMKQLYEFKDKHGAPTPLISKELYEIVQKYTDTFENIDYTRDYLIDYFGFKTLEKSYLMKIDGRVVERPQHMWLRVSIGIHGDNIDKILETYKYMLQKYFTHATPTLFNAGTNHPQLSSCYLIAMEDDSIDGIFNTLSDCAKISKWAGGIGLHIHNIRASGSHIRGTNGHSNGIAPMLRVFNNTAKYVDQGGGKRNGSFAIYLEPWHGDIEIFLQMRKNHGDEDMKARELFYAVWTPDLFMERVKKNDKWTLMCPDECPGLSDVYGDEFVELYESYERENKGRKTMNARDLWLQILDAQMETGTPYLLYKDAANRKSNQKNLGTIKSSNLCCEVIQYSDPNETAVCNLASIALPTFIEPLENDSTQKVFNYEKLYEITKIVTYNLNRIIDVNYYPTEKTRESNQRNRPIGIGVQGLADIFMILKMPFASEEAKEMNRRIFATIYYAALESSMEIAIIDGPYETFGGSPASRGELQFDLWGVEPDKRYFNWNLLKAKIKMYGLRNSLLLAPMPTASTSQILGYNECIEPITSNIYSRRTIAGEFMLVNKYLMADLLDLGIWNETIKNYIIANHGSIQDIAIIPENIRDIYKTVWEIPMKHLIDMAADRGIYICQSQSLNLWLEDPDYSTLTSMHFYGWSKGLKTGIYYLRRRGRHQAQQFTIEPEKQVEKSVAEEDDDYVCEMCSA
jgi:ribonucleoside-diphosphate reductase alpha chain